MLRRSRLLVLFALTTPAYPGCTLLGNFATEQCSLPEDCNALGEGPWRCEESVCVPPGQTSGGAECASNLECTALNDQTASVCNPTTKKCAPLAVLGPCKHGYGEVSDDMVTYAVVSPLFESSSTSPAADVTHMAIDEINQAGGLPTPGTNPPRRTTAFAVVCNQDAEEAKLTQALERLRDEVGVDAYLSEMPASMLQSYKQGVWAHELVLATRANEAPLLQVGFDEDDLLWHAVANIEAVEPLYFIAINEAIASLGLGQTEARVAIIQPAWGGGYGVLSGHIEATLSAMPGVDLSVEVLSENSFMAVTDVVDRLAAYDPHVIVDFVGDSFAKMMVPTIEGDPMTFGGDTVYVASPGSRYSKTLLLAAQNASLQNRFVGVELPTDRALYQSFVDRLPSFVNFGNAYGYNILYDAIYMMTYAVMAAGVTNLTPAKLADGLTRIDGGPAIFVGTGGGDSFEQGIQLLQLSREGDAFQFHGTTGPLEWIDPTGSRKTTIIGTYCLKPEATDAVAYDFGVRLYDPVNDQWVFIDPENQNQGACFPVP